MGRFCLLQSWCRDSHNGTPSPFICSPHKTRLVVTELCDYSLVFVVPGNISNDEANVVFSGAPLNGGMSWAHLIPHINVRFFQYIYSLLSSYKYYWATSQLKIESRQCPIRQPDGRIFGVLCLVAHRSFFP